MIFEKAWVFPEWELKASNISMAINYPFDPADGGKAAVIDKIKVFLIITETVEPVATGAVDTNFTLTDGATNIMFTTGLFSHSKFTTDLVKGKVIDFPEVPINAAVGLYFSTSAPKANFIKGKLRPMIALDLQTNLSYAKGNAFPT
jgi:hypothetical protein